jgi:hypothetical protein
MLIRFIAVCSVIVCLGVPSHAALIARYEFASGTPLADSSGNGYGLTQAGTVTFGSATIGSATLRTASATNGASTSSNVLSRTSGGFGSSTMDALTISLWGNFSSTQLNDDLIAASNGTGGWELQNTSSTTQYGVFQYTGGTSTAGSALGATTVTSSVWHHYVITQSAGTLSLYVDGTFRSSSSTALTGALTELYLFRGGVFNSGSARGWNGSLADVQVYDQALTLTQVNTMFNNPGTVAIPEPSLIGVIAAGVAATLVIRRRKIAL